tara:strand:+ start:722 stop:883 length:162 start_codon:yes stop_codon:yes gene_type:complete
MKIILLKLPAVELPGIFSVEYDFIVSSLANPAAELRGKRSLSTFNLELEKFSV